MSRRQWLLFGAALLALGLVKLALVAWYLRGHDDTAEETVSCAQGAGDCRLPGGARLRFLDQPRAGQPFSIELSGVTAGIEPAAEFSMQSMDMGFNRYRFVPDHAVWRLRATLPVCVSGRRDWQMTLLLDGHRYRMPLQVR
ncbi:hypothetical protein [Paludibacterium purpuratum]|uniref:Uncharacterized protein n=1 Tax=Paludibacterium purpuratum TaxID=1144873 RepID=A0A4V3DVL7_9NEIS|nr:hypothetical protein [Paludibacterium purpuratum]TDR81449.1 hypothetical protein DFP86_103102 [Paludibacterium purpuratum]